MSGIIASSSTLVGTAQPFADAPAPANDGAFQAALDTAIASQTNVKSESDQKRAESDAPKSTALNGQALSADDQAKVRTKIAKSAQDFEAMFLSQMMEPMFAGLKTEAPFGGGHGEENWRSFLVQEYGKAIAKRGGIGVAKMIETQMLDMAGLSGKTKPGNRFPTLGNSSTSPAQDAGGSSTAIPNLPQLPNALSDPTKFALPGLEIKA